MTPGEVAGLAAQINALHEDVLEVKELAKETNGRVRALELWRAEVTAKISVITASAKISVSNFIAPVITGAITASITALIFLSLQ